MVYIYELLRHRITVRTGKHRPRVSPKKSSFVANRKLFCSPNLIKVRNGKSFRATFAKIFTKFSLLSGSTNMGTINSTENKEIIKLKTELLNYQLETAKVKTAPLRNLPAP